MPELPEVETIRRELVPLLVGRRIRTVGILRPDIVGFPASRAFGQRLLGRRFVDAERRGKYLILHLNGSLDLVFHLRLSGRLRVVEAGDGVRHERLRFALSGSRDLVFAEPRVLGRAYAVRTGEKPQALRGLRRLGLEPLDPGFTARYLYERIHHRRARVKDLLLNQEIAAGVGNIYSDEALFLARIRPLRRANGLTHPEIRRLARALRRVLKDGVESMGTTVSDYQRPDGTTGRYQDRARVYGREGESCRRCRGRIASTRVGNRTTRFCPRCQK